MWIYTAKTNMYTLSGRVSGIRSVCSLLPQAKKGCSWNVAARVEIWTANRLEEGERSRNCFVLVAEAMQRRTEESIHGRMAEQRFACIREIEIQRQRADLAASSFRHSLLSVRSLSGQNLADRGPFLPSSALLASASERRLFLSIYLVYRFIITSLNPDLFSFFANSWISLPREAQCYWGRDLP